MPAAAPVYIVRPYPVRIFEGRGRLAAYGLPVLITALIFAALGILSSPERDRHSIMPVI